MNAYSDIIYLMGAMILFSLLTLNVSRNIVMNNQNMAQSEVEYAAIALAQGLVERAQWATKDQLNKDSGNYIFKDYDEKDVTIEMGSSNQYSVTYKVTVAVSSVNISADSENYLITVTVKNEEYLNSPITLEFINSFKN